MRRNFRNQLVNNKIKRFARIFVFSEGRVIRRKFSKLKNVSLTIIVVAGITSDVAKSPSVGSDGICKSKEKLVG